MGSPCRRGLRVVVGGRRPAASEYERIRKDPRQFCVIEEHVIQDIEAIVEDIGRFAIVAKRQGTPAEVAIRTDPRG